VFSLSNPRVPRKTQVFPEKILAVTRVPWCSDEVWLCSASSVLVVTNDTLVVVEKISRGLRAPLPVVVGGPSGRVTDESLKNSFLFGFSNGVGCLFDRHNQVKHVSFVASNPDEVEQLVDSSLALALPGSPIVVVARSKFGLCSWRLDTYGTAPKELLSSPSSWLEKRPSKASPDSSSGDGSRPPPRLELSSESSSGTGSSYTRSSLTKSAIHYTRNAMVRATVTCDENGKIISCNRGVFEIFGHSPASLVGTSVRALFFVPRTKERTGSVLLYSKQTPQRFSSSNLWKSIMGDLLKVRVVNGQCKDGSQVPLLISSSEMVVGGKPFYVLLFEQMSKKCAIVVVDESGVIGSASENLLKVIGWSGDRAWAEPWANPDKRPTESESATAYCPDCGPSWSASVRC
jgi:PAS domain S-box-containing protein